MFTHQKLMFVVLTVLWYFRYKIDIYNHPIFIPQVGNEANPAAFYIFSI